MNNTAAKPATYEDILGLPEHIIGEIINGRIESHPRPAPKHALANNKPLNLPGLPVTGLGLCARAARDVVPEERCRRSGPSKT